MPTFAAARSLRASALALAVVALLAGPAGAQQASAGPDPSITLAPSATPSPSAPPSPPAAALPLDVRPEASWVVRAFDAWAEGLVAPRPSSEVTVEFLADGRLEGLTGCGTYFGSYRVEGNDIAFSVTSKGPDPCGPKRIEEAVAFITALEAADTWMATPTGLALLDADGIIRVEVDPVVRAGLAGEWLVTAVARSGGILRATGPDGSASLILGTDGSVQGGTGCRLFEGEYSSEADQVLIVPFESIGLPCKGDERRAERRFLRALERVVFWQRDGAELGLTASDGAVLMELVETPA